MTVRKMAYGALCAALIFGIIFEYTIIQQHSQTIIDLKTELNQTKVERIYYRRLAEQAEDMIYEHEKVQTLSMGKLKELTFKYYSLMRKCMDTNSLEEIKEYITPRVENP